MKHPLPVQNRSFFAACTIIAMAAAGAFAEQFSSIETTGPEGAHMLGTLNTGNLAPAAPTLNNVPRLFWYPKKAAFRVGVVNGTAWDDASLGTYSFGAGYNVTASQPYATAFGFYSVASGASAAFACGYMTNAIGPFSFAAGVGTRAEGSNAVAMGNHTWATAAGTTSIGTYTYASGQFATATGYSTLAASYNSFVIGRFNVSEGSPNSWVNTEPLFVVGNGTGQSGDPNYRRNAFVIYKDGVIKMTKRQGDILMGNFGNPGD